VWNAVAVPSRPLEFQETHEQKIVGPLSGRERGRRRRRHAGQGRGRNVPLLDEPSNDLDVETLRALEESLAEFAGSVLMVSHDRWFPRPHCDTHPRSRG
jgi:ATPase subunit of ABC transporter with duplicated ATPase domains